MVKPLIGITCHSLPGACDRSAVNQAYIDAIVAAGGTPLLIPVRLEPDSIAQLFELIDGLLLPGGDDVAPAEYGEEPHAALGDTDPDRDALELDITRRALAADLPILGICRGIQMLAVAAGGTLYQDLPAQWTGGQPHEVREHGRAHLCHTIGVDPGSKLARAIGATTSEVNSFHHQAVREVPDGFAVTARSEDGLVEGMEAPGRTFVVAVQCHPEELWQTTAPEFAGLFRAFVDAARSRLVQVAV